VVAGTPSDNARANYTTALLNYGFRFFDTGKLFGKNEPVTTVRIWKGQQNELPVVAKSGVYISYPRGRRDELTTTVKLPSELTAPVQKGQHLGSLNIKYGDTLLKKIPLYAGTTVTENGLFG